MRTFATLRRLGVGISLMGLGLAACAPQGADPYSTSQLRTAQRQAGAAARAGTPPATVAASAQPVISTGELAAAGIPVAGLADGPAPAAAAGAAAVPAPGGHVGLSDEQDFDAVSARESIESDKERLAAQRAAYQQIAPEALPERRGDESIAVVDYALSTTNGLGEAVWPRPGRASQDRFNRACAKYPSQDVAQAEFLKSGGPQVDRRGVDPDGDGFACFWDPGPYRLARQGAVAAPVAREILPGEAPAGTVGADGTMVRTSEFDQTPLQ